MRASEIKTLQDAVRWAEIHEAYANPRHEAQIALNKSIEKRLEAMRNELKTQEDKINVLDKRISIIFAVATVVFTLISLVIKYIPFK